MHVPSLLRRLLAALPDAGIAATYALAVVDPAVREGVLGTALWRAAIMEFFAIHASGFLKWTWVAPEWSTVRRATFVAGLAAAYSTVLGIVSLLVGAWWPLATFWALTGNRIFDAAVREAPRGSAMVTEGRAWAGNLVLFVLVAAVAGMAGGGRLAVLVAGAVYFAANALSELGGWWWARRWVPDTRGR